jgi:hypothetical protein
MECRNSMNAIPPSTKSALVKALIAFATAIEIIADLFWYTGHRRGPGTGSVPGPTGLVTGVAVGLTAVSLWTVISE